MISHLRLFTSHSFIATLAAEKIRGTQFCEIPTLFPFPRCVRETRRRSGLVRPSRRLLMIFSHAVANLNAGAHCQVYAREPSVALTRLLASARRFCDIASIALFLANRSLRSPRSYQLSRTLFRLCFISRWIESESGTSRGTWSKLLSGARARENEKRQSTSESSLSVAYFHDSRRSFIYSSFTVRGASRLLQLVPSVCRRNAPACMYLILQLTCQEGICDK